MAMKLISVGLLAHAVPAWLMRHQLNHSHPDHGGAAGQPPSALRSLSSCTLVEGSGSRGSRERDEAKGGFERAEKAGGSRVERFRYLGSIIQENGAIDEDINHRIKVR